jgi:FkbM family methyltransferase
MTTVHSIFEINPITFVDVGAKGTIDYIKDIENLISIYAFEPNQVEHSLLKNKYAKNSFKFLEISPFALSDKKENRNFFVTQNNSMSSFLEPDLENYQKHFGHYKEFKSWKQNITQEKVINVATETLDNLFFGKNISIDYLKIDTQGSELSILKGAKKLLDAQQIKVLKVEVSLVAVYKNQVLFAEIDSFLREHNFILVDFVTYRNNYVSIFNSEHLNNHYAPCGDAIYFLKEEKNSELENIKMALILSWLGYKSLAINICENFKISDSIKSEIKKIHVSHKRSFIYRLAHDFTPPLIFNFLKKIKQKSLS